MIRDPAPPTGQYLLVTGSPACPLSRAALLGPGTDGRDKLEQLGTFKFAAYECRAARRVPVGCRAS